MRGRTDEQAELFHVFEVEKRIRADHPLRNVKRRVDSILESMSPLFAQAYTDAVAASRSSRHRGGQALQMMQKVLVQMNVHLHLVVADMAGLTGMRILRAICQGHRRPDKLAELRHPRCRKSHEEIAKALDGTWDTAHLFELKQLLKAWDFYQNQMQICDKEFEKAAGQLPDRAEDRPLPEREKTAHAYRNDPTFDSEVLIFKMTGVRVTEVDGLGPTTVLTVLSETGPDLATKFPTEKHFAAWTTLAPRKHQSGKRT